MDDKLEDHIFELQDKSGQYWADVKCRLPFEFDTIYRWHNHNPEMHCYGSIDYRSHSTEFEVVQENGMFQEPGLDSGYYFTILHSCFAYCDTPIVIGYRDFIGFEKNLKKRNENNSPELKIDTSISINGLFYDIISYNEIIGRLPFRRVEAYTTFNNRRLVFRIQNNIHKKDIFYKEANKILKNIKIEPI